MTSPLAAFFNLDRKGLSSSSSHASSLTRKPSPRRAMNARSFLHPHPTLQQQRPELIIDSGKSQKELPLVEGYEANDGVFA